MGISDIRKYLFMTSSVAVVPPLLAEVTQAAGLKRKLPPAIKILSMREIRAPLGDAK